MAPSPDNPGPEAREPNPAPGAALKRPVASLSRVGSRRAELFARLGLRTLADLVRHVPNRYEHLTAESPIAALKADAIGTARGTVESCRWVGRGRKGRFQATLRDDSGTLSLTWFNASYLRDKFHPGDTLRVQGKVKPYNGYPQMANPQWERLSSDDPDSAEPQQERHRPIYPTTQGLSSKLIEAAIYEALPLVYDELTDPLPEAVRTHHGMPPLRDAFRMLHQPEDEDEVNAARRRLKYNELLLLQLGVAVRRRANENHYVAPALRWSEAIDKHIRDRFPFALTDAQNRVVQQLAADLQRTRPMNRLVQGDVGSGKTVVALYAMLMAVADGKQAAMMAPTELLAEQHFGSIRRMLHGSGVRLALLTANDPDRDATKQKLQAGEIDLVVGTHALLTETVKFKHLAVAVVDEQHRFGVMQRAALREKSIDLQEHESKTPLPHTLVMTATPIPRTLSLTVFGDLDVSTIDQLPPGRKPIKTRVVDELQSDEVYEFVLERVKKGQQAYVVLPLIEEGGNEDEAAPLKGVTEQAERLQQRFGSKATVEIVHGRLSRDDREQVMERFRLGTVDVLVATTVIEVGVDVPNAGVMVIEHAERFGLAQLHQLRGRVGRGKSQLSSVCVGITKPTTEDAEARLKAFAKTTDGFKIAEEDLTIRGFGEFFGTRQHGSTPLRIAELPADLELLMLARRDAAALTEQDPMLTHPEHETLRKVLLNQYGEALGLIDIG